MYLEEEETGVHLGWFLLDTKFPAEWQLWAVLWGCRDVAKNDLKPTSSDFQTPIPLGVSFSTQTCFLQEWKMFLKSVCSFLLPVLCPFISCDTWERREVGWGKGIWEVLGPSGSVAKFPAKGTPL